jgi:hypothetical protein
VIPKSFAIGVRTPVGKNSAIMSPATPKEMEKTAFHAGLVVSVIFMSVGLMLTPNYAFESSQFRDFALLDDQNEGTKG